jgi:hypothetical protein
MSARLRKFIGLFGILGFLTAYVGAIAKLAEHLPDHWLAKLVFYLAAGVLWGVPILPLIRWMNSGR